jgi:hypothetical protein
MTQATHTPGPWTIIPPTKYESEKILAGDRKHYVATFKGFGYIIDPAVSGAYRSMAETHANARLIAAAPELLAVLEMAVLRVELANSDGNPILSAWLLDARAAIAKATSESMQ